MAWVRTAIKWLRIRVISPKRVRIHLARSGTSAKSEGVAISSRFFKQSQLLICSSRVKLPAPPNIPSSLLRARKSLQTQHLRAPNPPSSSSQDPCNSILLQLRNAMPQN